MQIAKIACIFLISTAGLVQAAPPIAPAAENPRLFRFRGVLTPLVTSGEHYGALLNRDFDFVKYFDELSRCKFNLTRVFSGTYREVPGSFRIENNTLAPRDSAYLSPWARTADGKFDLDRLNPAYFERLTRLLAEASKRGIVAELVLFCPFYEEDLWAVNPMNAKNNINGIGNFHREEAYTLKHPELLKRQVAFVEAVVAAVKSSDNVYFEICNEPYFGGVTLDWQAKIAETIAAAEAKLKDKHMISQNIANNKAVIKSPHPAVSLFNFHYAAPPDVLAMNKDLNRPIGDDETGFNGVGDRAYRTEAWEFLLAGGAVFNNLDYSFTAGKEDGSATVREPTPGGGGRAFRRQLTTLKSLLEGMESLDLKPNAAIVNLVSGAPKDVRPWCLANHRRAYLAYVRSGSRVTLQLTVPSAKYRYEWIDPMSGSVIGSGVASPSDGNVRLTSPEHREDIALKLVAEKE